MRLAETVKIAKDVKVLPLVAERTDEEARASVLGHMSPDDPENMKAENKIESYKDIYDGDMYKFVDFTYAYAAISRKGDFGDGQTALIHMEDQNGAYRDMLFPSMRIIGEGGTSERIDRMSAPHWMQEKSISWLLERREKDLRDYAKNRAEYCSRCWHMLYADGQIEHALHSGIHYDADGERVYVYLEFFDYQAWTNREIVVRLPEGEITEVTVEKPEAFDLDSLRTRTVARVLQRLAHDAKVIFELARTGAKPGHTEDDMNRLRDKIGGKIARRLVEHCPYCGENLLDERVRYAVRIPVRFCMSGIDFEILEDEMYQTVTEAVEAGTATGVCGHCGHELTSEDINRVKDGWQYRYHCTPHALIWQGLARRYKKWRART